MDKTLIAAAARGRAELEESFGKQSQALKDPKHIRAAWELAVSTTLGNGKSSADTKTTAALEKAWTAPVLEDIVHNAFLPLLRDLVAVNRSFDITKRPHKQAIGVALFPDLWQTAAVQMQGTTTAVPANKLPKVLPAAVLETANQFVAKLLEESVWTEDTLLATVTTHMQAVVTAAHTQGLVYMERTAAQLVDWKSQAGGAGDGSGGLGMIASPARWKADAETSYNMQIRTGVSKGQPALAQAVSAQTITLCQQLSQQDDVVNRWKRELSMALSNAPAAAPKKRGLFGRRK